VDQDLFRKTYREVNERFCAYEKSILTNQCDCSQAARFCIAEREGVRCGSEQGQQRCLRLLEFLRNQARFALRSTEDRSTIPHGKAMKVQVGGLRGLKSALAPEEPVPATIDDVDATIQAALGRFGDLDSLPLQTIIQHITAYQGRKRARRNR
jgi:hypothetical protein